MEGKVRRGAWEEPEVQRDGDIQVGLRTTLVGLGEPPGHQGPGAKVAN